MSASAGQTGGTWSAPVRYAECDQQGVVFNSHYLLWCDEAVTAWFESTGASYAELLARGLDTMVVSSTLDWSSAARYGDVVEVRPRADRVGRTSFTVAFDITAGERSCCRVRTTYVMLDGQGRPTPVPDDLRQGWEAAPAVSAG
jgi:acyl-CoA thioester hydrolase